MRYRTLFRVDVQHDYFSSVGAVPSEVLPAALQADVERHYAAVAPFSLAPTSDTRRQLAGRRMIFRAVEQGFIVLVAVSAANPAQPLIALDPTFRLRFALQVHDPNFFNYTALSPDAERFHFFSNEPGNSAGDGRFLSAAVPAFEPARGYRAGDVRSAPAAAGVDCFIALRDTGPSAAPIAADWRRIPPDTFSATNSYVQDDLVLSGNRIFRARVNSPLPNLADASQWEAASTLGNQYVTRADAMELVGDVLEVDLSAAALQEAVVDILRGSSVVHSETVRAAVGNLARQRIELGALEPGRYQLAARAPGGATIPGVARSFYADREAIAQGWFGVIDVGLGSGNMALTSGTNTLANPRFTLRFLNRNTRWRYLFPAAQAVGAGAEVVAEGDPHALVSPIAHPLTHFGRGLVLQSDDPATGNTLELVRLPRPEPAHVRYASAEWFSDVHSLNLQL